MRADIALGDGAENGVGDGVSEHVGVGMAGEPVIMGNRDAAEPDVIARREGVDVIALSGANIRQVVEQQGFRAQKVLPGGEFEIARIALEYVDGVAGAFGDHGVVGELQRPRRRRAMRL